MSRKKRGPRYDHAFLRNRLAETARSHVSEILSSSRSYVLPDSREKIQEILVDLASYIRNLEGELARKQTSDSPPPADSSPSAETGSEAPKHVCKLKDVNNVLALSNVFERLSFGTVNTYERHYGKSSNVMLLKTAMDMRGEITGETNLVSSIFQGFKRAEFWQIYPWQVETGYVFEPYVFPEDDLLHDLVEIYFSKINIYMPLLHRPTFIKALEERFYLIDRSFGALVLALCALASRQSDDPRNAYSDKIDSKLSYGWKWFRQIQFVGNSFINHPCVYALQLYCLAALFMNSSSIPHGTWTLTGLGIRYAQEMGAHRRQLSGQKPTIQSELWKRGFWVLLTIDVLVSLSFGRPQATIPEDYDVEYPLEVDDEYWEHPDHPFTQPPGKPSVITGWVHYLKLIGILGQVHRGIYSIRRSPWSNYGIQFDDPEYDQKTVLLLDSDLNKWIDSVPEHVKWDKNRENCPLFNQSVMLYATYYWVQIQVHKTFIPRPEQNNSILSSFPSLAICANAARSCVHILESQNERQFVPIPLLLPSFLTASIVLVLNIWRGKRVHATMDLRKELKDVYRCMRIVKCYESNYEIAGRLYDLLHHLIALTRLPLPPESNNQTETEDRDLEGPSMSVQATSSSAMQQPALTRSPLPPESNNQTEAEGSDLAGPPMSVQVTSSSAVQQPSQVVDSIPEFQDHRNCPTEDHLALSQDPLAFNVHGSGGTCEEFCLPFRSNELGHLPVHGSFIENQIQIDQDFNMLLDEDWSLNLSQVGTGGQAFGDGSEQLEFGHEAAGTGDLGSSGQAGLGSGLGYPVQSTATDLSQTYGVPFDEVFFLNVGNNHNIRYEWSSYG